MAAARANPYSICICIYSAAASSAGPRARISRRLCASRSHTIDYRSLSGGLHVLAAPALQPVSGYSHFFYHLAFCFYFRGAATDGDFWESSYGGTHLFAVELERAVDARACVDAGWQAAQLFRDQGFWPRSEDGTLGDGHSFGGATASDGCRQSRNDSPGGHGASDASHWAWPARSRAIPMGAGRRRNSVSGTDGARLVRPEVTGGAHARIRESRPCRS